MNSVIFFFAFIFSCFAMFNSFYFLQKNYGPRIIQTYKYFLTQS